MYKDLNGDGHIDSYDQCYISRGDVPAYYYGFGGDIRWKNFGLGFLFQGVADAERQLQGSGIRPFTNSSGGGTLFANITLERVRPDQHRRVLSASGMGQQRPFQHQQLPDQYMVVA